MSDKLHIIPADLREEIMRRLVRTEREEFLARGMRSRDEARKTGGYVSVTAVLANLEKRLLNAKAEAKQKIGAAAKTKSRK